MNTRDIVFSVSLAACLLVIGFLTVVSYILFAAVVDQQGTMHQQRQEYNRGVEKEREEIRRMRDYIKRTKRVDRE